MPRYRRSTTIGAPVQALYEYHRRPGALQRLLPPWQDVRVMRSDDSLEPGAEVLLRMGAGPFHVNWLARHTDLAPGERFVDEQVSGPFRRWVHTHRFERAADASAVLEDDVEFRLPLGSFSESFATGLAERELDRMFRFRHHRTRHDVMRHEEHADQARQTVAITGASGLVGAALAPFLETGGHTPIAVVRSESEPDEIRWSVAEKTIDADRFRGVDTVVHLAGEPLVGRWTDAKKKRILDSRVEGTRLIAETLAALDDGPKTLICASAVGYYGRTGDEQVDETSPAGDDFLARVCQQWEAAAAPAREAGIRVVHLRFGVVLSAAGGALAKMLPAFKMGVGGKLGSGDQWFSWVALDDVIGAIYHAMFTDELAGPVNVTAPRPVTNEQFTETLGEVLHRPTFMTVPKLAVKAAFGEMGEATLLGGQRVFPRRLIDTGFVFEFNELEEALRHELGK